MEQSQYNFLFSFIWNIANDVLVNAFNKGDWKSHATLTLLATQDCPLWLQYD